MVTLRRHNTDLTYCHSPPYNALKVDVWSLGATIWEMAQAEPPFSEVQDSRLIPHRWPSLRQSEIYSRSFHDFLHLCSQPSSLRPDPDELLKVRLPSSYRNVVFTPVPRHHSSVTPVADRLFSSFSPIAEILRGLHLGDKAQARMGQYRCHNLYFIIPSCICCHHSPDTYSGSTIAHLHLLLCFASHSFARRHCVSLQ